MMINQAYQMFLANVCAAVGSKLQFSELYWQGNLGNFPADQMVQVVT